MSDPQPTPIPAWKLPYGVNASLWEYSQTPRLAREEDLYFAGHPLFRADRRALDQRFIDVGRLIDLGCGSGRLSIHFARRGFDVTSVDLSPSMVALVKSKAAAENLSVDGLRASLCNLQCLHEGVFDYAISMFSTLGMIRGAAARQKALRETYRILKPRGRLAIHAHNVWLNFPDRQGRKWLLEQFRRFMQGKPDCFDRRMLYRGIPDMEVHLYRWGELRRTLRRAGFAIEEVIPIETTSAEVIHRPWLFPSFRAGGWIVFARKPR